MKKRLLVIASLFALIAVSFLAGTLVSRPTAANNKTPEKRKVAYYVDPMHPAYKSNKPGMAPDCGMPLVPVYQESASSPPSANGLVEISPLQQQLIGVHVAPAETSAGAQMVKTLGKVVLDETRVFRVAPPVDGLIRNAGPIASGSLVAKNQVLATYYNRDFLTAQQTYLYALNTMDRGKADKESPEQVKLTDAQIRAAAENLEFLGMSDTQIQEVQRTRQLARNIEIRSPASGVVLARNVFSGVRFERGSELFRIAELAHIWILADVSEDQAQYLRPGTVAQVTLSHIPKVFNAKVTDTVPLFDASSRTLKMRLEVDNPNYQLRPDMLVDVQLPLRMPPGLTVPLDAVLDSGTKKRVFVARGNGFFEPREVETGWSQADRVQITKGLQPGDRVVTSATFLIDSESRLKAESAQHLPTEP